MRTKIVDPHLKLKLEAQEAHFILSTPSINSTGSLIKQQQQLLQSTFDPHHIGIDAERQKKLMSQVTSQSLDTHRTTTVYPPLAKETQTGLIQRAKKSTTKEWLQNLEEKPVFDDINLDFETEIAQLDWTRQQLEFSMPKLSVSSVEANFYQSQKWFLYEKRLHVSDFL